MDSCYNSLMDIVIIIFSVAAVAAVIAIAWTKSQGIEINSFWDALRNPDAMPDLTQFHKHVEDRASAISGSRDQIAKLVDYFVFEAKSSDDAWAEKRVLAKLGKEAYPRALEILNDTSSHERLTVLTDSTPWSQEAPICRLTEIFDHDAPPPPEAADLLSPFLKSPSAVIRKRAAGIIGSVGSSRSLPDLRRALKDEDDYVKSYALMGIQRAIAGERIKGTEKSQFYELVAGMWPEDTSFPVCEKIPTVMLGLDRTRSLDRLLAPDLFTLKFARVLSILEAFAEESIEIPRGKLLILIEDANREPIDTTAGVLGKAVSLLGRYRMQEDVPTLERLADHPNEKVARGAIKGLYSYHRYFEAVRDPWEVVDTAGWGALTVPEKHICAINELDGQVNNGGFAQYYFNSTGDHWRDALEGLRAIGATQRHKIMVATLEKFRQSEPSPSRDVRSAQLSKIVRKKEDPFNEQDAAWYKIEGELLDRLQFLYNFANIEGRSKAR